MSELAASASEPPPATCTLFSRLSETKPPLAFRFHVGTVVAAPADAVSAQVKATAATPTAAVRIRPLMLHYPFRPHSVGTPTWVRTGPRRQPCAPSERFREVTPRLVSHVVPP